MQSSVSQAPPGVHVDPGRSQQRNVAQQYRAPGTRRRSLQSRSSQLIADGVPCPVTSSKRPHALGALRAAHLDVSAANVADGGSVSSAQSQQPQRRDEERRNVKESWDRIMRWARLTTQQQAGEDVLGHTKKVAVLGGGSFGTAMATLLARNKDSLEVVLLLRDPATCASVNERHINERYLKQYTLPPNVRATTDASVALSGADYIVHAVPVQQSTAFLQGLRHQIPATTPILCLSKGLEVGTCRNMSQIIDDALGRQQPLAVLSGPTFAVEIMQGLPTAIVAASTDPELALRVQRLFASSNLRVNTSSDVIGVEVAGALKNVLAIAAGIVEGLQLGNNAMAALVAQGCSEIRWLAERMGADPVTLSGLSGVGDIMLTCFVPLSRNRTVGVRLGKGESLAAILASSTQVAEGVATASAVVVLARRHRVALPVLTAVARILDGELSPREAVDAVMSLPQRPEI